MEPRIMGFRTCSTRIVFFGTSSFAIPALEALLKNGYQIAGVITNPDKPAGRDLKPAPSPVKIFAEKNHLKTYQPEKPEIGAWKSEAPEGDLFIVAAYGKIIPREIFDLPRYKTINIHPSLLPRGRGPSPIQYAILNGDAKTGVTLMLIDERMDHGPILAQQELATPDSKIQISNVTYGELHDALACLGAELLVETLPRWIDGAITPVPQDTTKATYTKLVKKDDARIDWKKTALEIERMIRAFCPKPGTWTIWPSREKMYRVRIEKGLIVNDEPLYGSPGYIWSSPSHALLVRTGQQSLSAQSLGIEGRNMADADSFVRGYPQIIGSNFI